MLPAAVFLLLLEPGLSPAAAAEKKQSEAARQNPVIREYFKSRALEMQPSLNEETAKRNLDNLVNMMIDDFTERILSATDKMKAASQMLLELKLELEKGRRRETLQQAAFRERLRAEADALHDAARQLGGSMDIFLFGLKVRVKAKDDAKSLSAENLGPYLETLHSLVLKFERQIMELFFPSTNTISLEELGRESFPHLLKMIQSRSKRLRDFAAGRK